MLVKPVQIDFRLLREEPERVESGLARAPPSQGGWSHIPGLAGLQVAQHKMFLLLTAIDPGLGRVPVRAAARVPACARVCSALPRKTPSLTPATNRLSKI